MLFTENESEGQFRKDAFHRYLVEGESDAVNQSQVGSKAALVYRTVLDPGESRSFDLILAPSDSSLSFFHFEATLQAHRAEADQFYDALDPGLDRQDRRIWRQAYAGLLWSRLYYQFSVQEWLEGDPGRSAPPADQRGRNDGWGSLYARDILLMPDAWEYPWFVAWDLAFHVCPMARLDPEFAKEQLLLLLHERYLHPNGQMPAYELGFSEVNPPVHAWACLRVFQATGATDRQFLERAFHKLLLNFTWWLNRTDADGKNAVGGGFLGLDNISIFDRNALPEGLGKLNQADGTAWVGFFSLRMMQIALLLAEENEAYQDIAAKFLEHFVAISDFINADSDGGLWHEDDRFYYDFILPDEDDAASIPVRVRSLVGLLPLIAVEVLDWEKISSLPRFRERLDALLTDRPHQKEPFSFDGMGRVLLSLVPVGRLRHLLKALLDEDEFLSPHGLRSLSKRHQSEPFRIEQGEETLEVRYEPGESPSGMLGGNSNWRGPVWFPANHLLLDALRCYHSYFGEDFVAELPTGSGHRVSLEGAVQEIERRLASLFREGATGARPALGALNRLTPATLWTENFLFHEYFHGETGEGLGASHQTGWTALVAVCLESLPGKTAPVTCQAGG